MPNYVDGYILPLPKKKVAAYQKIAAVAAKVWREHGALEYRECVGEDLKTPFGVGFPKQFKLKSGETIVFAYVVFKSRAHRDKVNAAVMKDPRLSAMCDEKNMPFDPKRMLWGGFTTIVEA
ncbi:MAG: DUF1428 domain-containing protein [Opitutus sp.]|nr:DUF1428 domain-containing protein [Opitutus sp.]